MQALGSDVESLLSLLLQLSSEGIVRTMMSDKLIKGLLRSFQGCIDALLDELTGI